MNLSNKTVLVTGADGFIGSHLVERLVSRVGRVRALSYYNARNDWGWLEAIPCLPEIEVIAGDIRDPFFCGRATAGIDVVFHLAALIGIPYSYAAPDSYLETNVKGTLNICEAARANGCERVIHTSTSEVYGTARRVPIDEDHPLQPQSPYSASKIGADALALSCHAAFGLPVVVARPFNTYGPRQSARAVIPTIIAQAVAGRGHVDLGDLRPTRDFNFVLDTADAFVAIAAADACVGEVVNIATGTEVSIGQLLQLVGEIMGCDLAVRHDAERDRPAASEVFRLCGSAEKLRRLTGAMPRHDLRAGLEQTVAWFRDPGNLARYKAELYNV